MALEEKSRCVPSTSKVNMLVPDELGTFHEPEVTAMAADDNKNTKSTKENRSDRREVGHPGPGA